LPSAIAAMKTGDTNASRASVFSTRMSSLVQGLGFVVFFAIGRFIRIPLLRCSNQHESKGRSRLISSLAGAAWRWSCATQLTFLRSAFMLLVSAFDPILVLMAIVR